MIILASLFPTSDLAYIIFHEARSARHEIYSENGRPSHFPRESHSLGDPREPQEVSLPKFLAKRRIHDEDSPDEELLAEFSPEEIRDILAYLSIVDD